MAKSCAQTLSFQSVTDKKQKTWNFRPLPGGARSPRPTYKLGTVMEEAISFLYL